MRIVLIGLGLLLFIGGCSTSHSQTRGIPFKLHRPDRTYKLPKELTEISGLGIYRSRLIAVQDEVGELYLIDLRKKPLGISQLPFAGKGDYECLEAVGDNIYVLTSEGSFYRIGVDTNLTRTFGVTKFDLPYKKNENFEGMCFDPSKNRLLISAKESPENGRKNIYPLYPEDAISRQDPVITLDVDTLDKFVHHAGNALGLAISGEKYAFNPSALAIDPITGNVFVLSHPLQQLLVLDINYRPLAAVYLNPAIFQQPEGMTFDSAGNLYISNEGKSGNGNILYFKRIPEME